MVYLPDYNETYLWKKWNRKLKAFGQESYEPDVDTKIQDKLNELEEENAILGGEVSTLNNTISGLNDNVQLLEGTIAELMAILATIGGAE